MKRILSVLVVLVLAMGIVACSGTQTKTDESEVSTKVEAKKETEDEVTTEKKIEEVELRMVINSETLSQPMQDAVDQFMAENEGVTVNVETVPWRQFLDKTTIMFAAGTAPDVIHMPVLATRGYAQGGHLADLTPYLSQEDLNDFVESGLETVKYEDGIYGMPHFLDSVAVFYNKDAFKTAGIEVPTTSADAYGWEKFVEVATEVQGATDSAYGLILSSDVSRAMPFLYQNNATILNEDQSGAGINTPEAVESLAYMQSWFTSGAAPVEAFLGAEDPEAMFMSQKAPIIVTASGYVSKFTAEITDFDYGVMYMPRNQSAGNKMGGWNLCVSENTEYHELSAELVRVITSTENGAAMAATNGAVPSRTSSQAIVDYGDNQEFAKVISDEVNMMPGFAVRDVATPQYLGYKAILTEQMQLLALEETTPEEAAEKMEELINTTLFK